MQREQMMDGYRIVYAPEFNNKNILEIRVARENMRIHGKIMGNYNNRAFSGSLHTPGNGTRGLRC
jgi:hypothetical protein